MVEGLKRGDKVITSGGITGTVERIIDNDKVEVEIAENIKVEIVKATGIRGFIKLYRSKKIIWLIKGMLYFSKLRIIFISIICLFFIIIASNNLLTSDNKFIDKRLILV